MNIIAHRGFWKIESEKNSKEAIKRAIDSGFGFETDFRDYGGKILISHNPPIGTEITADDVFRMYFESGSHEMLALNIKSDGLQDMIGVLLKKYGITNYFFFDMSVCDTIIYVEKQLQIASRRSEYEKELPFYNDSTTVWVDFFYNETLVIPEVKKYLGDGKSVCVVSPELHNREYANLWKQLKSIHHSNLYLCTDYPDKAKEFFN